MTFRAVTIGSTFLAAGLFAWTVPIERVLVVGQPLMIALSIMVAAVFVRLNRGMPPLEWKSVDPAKRLHLTSSILDLTRDYGWIIGTDAVALGGLTVLIGIGGHDISAWPEGVRRLVSAVIGGLMALCSARMAYVVWRDVDVVRLQKTLIDDMAIRDANDRERDIAEDRLVRIRSANLRTVESKPPKAWGQ
ncbi:hypothetical protein [Acidiphilium acidophilum]|uniref:hypothetical protein n=1 Tax=Acidiphilium acidophilum TaxID=76588 RepID=UPI002E8E750C|nr:hypothetical protein [Acidiphilium acidophilum]